MAQYMVTGSATEDGRPLYMTAEEGWSDRITEAHVVENDGRLALLETAKTHERVVCDPYPIEVTPTDHGYEPITLKEKIRASGPTIDLL